jgi:cyanophycinase
VSSLRNALLNSAIPLFRGLLVAAVIASCAPLSPPSGPAPETRFGPPRGHLVVAGGGDLTGTGIVERFVELAGGRTARIVVIPTADGSGEYDLDWPGLDILRNAGARNITVLHTTDRLVADSEEFVGPLREATGVWIPGGRQWRLADAYLDTRTDDELDALLSRGGVVGGSSAGASIQASFLVRGAPEGNHIVMAPGHERGFGLLRGAAVDQHLLVRRRERDLLQILEVHPQLLGIGIDERTAIVVRGDSFEVIGASQVAVYDGTELGGGAGYYLLPAGASYDMQGKQPIGRYAGSVRTPGGLEAH